MKTTIAFTDRTENHTNIEVELDELALLIQLETDLRVHRIHKPAQTGQKSIDLLTALEIINVSLTGLGTLIAVMSYWCSQKKKYTISFKKGNVNIQLDNIPPEQLETELARLQEEPTSEEFQILIAE